MERLREEVADAPCAGDDEFVFFAELVDAENGDDVLQFLIALQQLLHPASHFVMLFAEQVRVEDVRRGFQRVDGGEDAEGSDVAVEQRLGVEVREGGGRAGSVKSSAGT